MRIDVAIPYEPDRQLGFAYNRHIKGSNADWFLFLDHDVLLCTPYWYDLCLSAIKKYGKTAGWISGVTNRIGCHWQRANEYDVNIDENNDNVEYHYRKGAELYNKHKYAFYEPPDYAPFSGLFILTHREAWEKAWKNNVPTGWMIDNSYDKKLRESGYKRIIIKGLYMYHIKNKKKDWL